MSGTVRVDTDTVTMATTEIPLRHDLPRGRRVHSAQPCIMLPEVRQGGSIILVGEKLGSRDGTCFYALTRPTGGALLAAGIRDNRRDRFKLARHTPMKRAVTW